MAKIHYSLSGEGRGHAARAQVLVNLLKERHQMVVHAYGAALEMLRPIFRGSDVEVREIPGLRFVYSSHGTLNRPGSLLGALPFLAQLSGRAQEMARQLEQDKVDLVISDFEPLLPRAAGLAQIPVMSVDHQQFLTSYDLTALPAELRSHARLLAPFVRPYYKKLTRAVISAFFFPTVKKTPHPVTQVGVLLRPSILEARPEHGHHLVAYVRREAPQNVLQALSECGRQVRVYGHSAEGSYKNLSFLPINPSAFAQDLACAVGLVTTAGNQVVGEALSLKKPVLAFPEPGNFEQQINGFFLEESGQGWSRAANSFDARLVRRFIEKAPLLSDRIRPERLNGNRPTLAAVEYEISAATQKGAVFSHQVSEHDPHALKLSPRLAAQAFSRGLAG